MSYRNIFSIFESKWIDHSDIEIVLKNYPESDFEVCVTFSDKSDMYLKDCMGKESNVEKIVFAYRDGTSKLTRSRLSITSVVLSTSRIFSLVAMEYFGSYRDSL